MLSRVMSGMLDDLLHLLYPNLCVGCQQEAVYKDELFCISCESKLPITDFHQLKNNEAIDRLVGGFPFTMGVSMFRFYPGGIVQNMIHKIKYRGQTNISWKLGYRYGSILQHQDVFKDLHCLIPVPLHPRKLRARGYNQSKAFAEGLATAFHLHVSTDYLHRVIETSSQTSKSRFDRLESMMGAFKVSAKSSELSGKHILLVDDVLTTGSTLESCAQAMSSISDIRISFATIALAQ